MRIIQVSDLHHARMTWNLLRCLSKRLIGQLNYVCKRASMFDPKQREALPELFQSLKADLILIGGDLTTTSLPEEFEEAKAFIKGLGIPVLTIPGNHDCYTQGSHQEQRFYNYFPSSLKEHGVERHDLTANWTLVAFDTTLATGLTSSRGLFSPKAEENLDKLLSQISSKRSILLWTHYPLFPNDSHSRGLERAEALRALVRRYPNICCFLHGHTHRHAIADLRPSGFPVVLDSGCPIQKGEGSLNLLELTPNACKVESYHWDQGWGKRREQAFIWD